LGQNSWSPFGVLATSCYFSIVREVGTIIALDDYTMKKTPGFYAQVLVDVDMLSSLLQ